MKELPTRKSLRLKQYDYSRNGAYFITICTYNREHLLGHIVGADDPVRPSVTEESEIGQIARTCWNEINNIYQNIRTDKFCIMPNHVHGIIFIENGDGHVERDAGGQAGDVGGQGRPPLHKVLQGYKSVTTRMCFQMGHQKIWQRSYHDRIIRSEAEYQKIWQYIEENPTKWEEDEHYR